MAEKPTTIYCCYASADQPYVYELKKHLAFLENQSLLAIWQNTDIQPGTDLKKERSLRLHSADIVLIFVSPDFLASNVYSDTEMQAIIQQHALGNTHVIPILTRPVHWQGTLFSHLQALPTNGVPISSWSHLDEALFDVTQDILTALQKLLGDHFIQQHTRGTKGQPEEPLPAYKQKSSTIFNQWGHTVHGGQNNAGGDINFHK